MISKILRSSVSLKVRSRNKMKSFASRYKKKKKMNLHYKKIRRFFTPSNGSKVFRKLFRSRTRGEIGKQKTGYSDSDENDPQIIPRPREQEKPREEEKPRNLELERISSGEQSRNMIMITESTETRASEEEEQINSELGIDSEKNFLVTSGATEPNYDYLETELDFIGDEESMLHYNLDFDSNGNDEYQEFGSEEDFNISLSEVDIASLMALQFRETRLQSHIKEHQLNLVPRDPTRNDGNCWYDAIADQIILHEVPNKPTDHAELRRAVCEEIPHLPQTRDWVQNIFGDEGTFAEFVEEHSQPGVWTDSFGIMCQATALYVGRNINIIGTANIGQGSAFTKLESTEAASDYPAFTVGYYQDRHYQSLQEHQEDISPNSSVVTSSEESSTDEESLHRKRNEMLLQESDEDEVFSSEEEESDSDLSDEEYFNNDSCFDGVYYNNDDCLSEMLEINDLPEEVKDKENMAAVPVKKTVNVKFNSRNLLDRLI